jgi:hypothetical protein
VRALLAAALLALTAPAAGQEATCPGGLCGAEALNPWFEDLARLEAGAPIKVHVVQIGDSHTAGEVTSRARCAAGFEGRSGAADGA